MNAGPGLLLDVAGKTQSAARIVLAQEWRIGVVMHIVTGSALHLGIEKRQLASGIDEGGGDGQH